MKSPFIARSYCPRRVTIIIDWPTGQRPRCGLCRGSAVTQVRWVGRRSSSLPPVASGPVLGYLHSTDNLPRDDHPHRADRPTPSVQGANGSQPLGPHPWRPLGRSAEGTARTRSTSWRRRTGMSARSRSDSGPTGGESRARLSAIGQGDSEPLPLACYRVVTRPLLTLGLPIVFNRFWWPGFNRGMSSSYDIIDFRRMTPVQLSAQLLW